MKILEKLDPLQGYTSDSKDVFLCVHKGLVFLSHVLHARRKDETYVPVVAFNQTEMVPVHRLEEFYLIKEV